MFIADKIVFLELHKTGGTHIGRWLDLLVGGEQRGKHNRLSPELRDKFILGSIRNPWDWYVSLWAYGCQCEGSVYHQTVRPFSVRYCQEQLGREMGKKRLSVSDWFRQYRWERHKPLEQWRACYSDVEDPALFRAWLKLLFSERRSFDVGEGFGFSPVSLHAGLLGYRYAKLFTDLGDGLYSDVRLGDQHGFAEMMNSRCIVDYVIRNEALEEDLLDSLSIAGVSLDEALVAKLQDASQKKTNTSKHLGSSYYYDDETLEMVAVREKFLIEKYGYQPPN